MAARRGLFPPDPRLQVCMAVVLALVAAVTTAAVAALVWLTVFVHDGWSVAWFIVMFALLGAGATAKGRRRRGRGVAPADRARVEALVERLCTVGDIRPPGVSVENDRLPQSWTVAVPWHAPRVSVTTGLLDRLDDRQLAAVLGHELSHIAQRDALVMTMAAAPGLWILRGTRRMWDEDRFRAALGLPILALLALLAAPWALLARVLSRYRELAADAGAARLTGSPAAVAAALVALSDDASRRRRKDLRAAAAPAVLNIVPLRPARGLARLWATHPPLKRRLAALERMKARLQRPAVPA